MWFGICNFSWMHLCIPTVPAEGWYTCHMLPVCQENLPCTHRSVLSTLLWDEEGVSVSGCRVRARNGSCLEFWRLKVTLDATLRKDIQHLIRIYIRCPTNSSLCLWMYGFGLWWSQQLWWGWWQKASSCWWQGSAWDKVSESASAFAASPPLKLLTKLHPEL